jgi:hypothetical protein
MSDEALVAHWAENVVWQYFSGQEYDEPRLPCDATQLGRFRTVIGKEGVETLLKATIDTAMTTQAIRPAEFERIIVDSTIVGIVMREIHRKLKLISGLSTDQLAHLNSLLERAERIRTQQPKDKKTLCATCAESGMHWQRQGLQAL